MICNLYYIKLIKTYFLLLNALILIFHSSCSNHSKRDIPYFSSIKINEIDSLLLVSKNMFSIYKDYNRKTGQYLSKDINNTAFFLHDSEGNREISVQIPSEGPKQIDRPIDIIFDEDRKEVLILTNKEIVRFSILGELKDRCPLPFTGIMYAGYSSPRIIPYSDFYIIALLDETDTALEIGSMDFVRKAMPIKILNKENCKCVDSIGYPENSIFLEGVFQPTFYEPQISIDFPNRELEVVYFQVENFIHRYDLSDSSFKYKGYSSIRDEKLQFVKPIDWERRGSLKSKFQHDHQFAKIINIFNFNGYTIVGYVYDKNLQKSMGSGVTYVILNNDGDHIGFFEFEPSDNFDYIVDHKEGNRFFAFPDLESMVEEPHPPPEKSRHTTTTRAGLSRRSAADL